MTVHSTRVLLVTSPSLEESLVLETGSLDLGNKLMNLLMESSHDPENEDLISNAVRSFKLCHFAHMLHIPIHARGVSRRCTPLLRATSMAPQSIPPRPCRALTQCFTHEILRRPFQLNSLAANVTHGFTAVGALLGRPIFFRYGTVCD